MIITFSGPHGVGKTTLIEKCSERIQKEFNGFLNEKPLEIVKINELAREMIETHGFYWGENYDDNPSNYVFFEKMLLNYYLWIIDIYSWGFERNENKLVLMDRCPVDVLAYMRLGGIEDRFFEGEYEYFFDEIKNLMFDVDMKVFYSFELTTDSYKHWESPESIVSNYIYEIFSDMGINTIQITRSKIDTFLDYLIEFLKLNW